MKIFHDASRATVANTRAEDIDSLFEENTFNASMMSLQTKFPSLFEGKNATRNKQWKVATWSRKLERRIGSAGKVDMSVSRV